MIPFKIDRKEHGPVGYLVKSIDEWEGANRVTQAFNMAIDNYVDFAFCGDEVKDKFIESCRLLVNNLNEMNPEEAVILKVHECGDGLCLDILQDQEETQLTTRMILRPIYGFVTIKLKDNESNL